jgi:hypothetical protein
MMRRKSSGINIYPILALICVLLTVAAFRADVKKSQCPENCTETVSVQPLGYDEKEYTSDHGTSHKNLYVLYEYEYEGKKYQCKAKFHDASADKATQMFKKTIKINPKNPSEYYIPGEEHGSSVLPVALGALTVFFLRCSIRE